MTIKKLLIANRGEISIRIARAAAELGVTSVAVYAEDDESCLHTRKADEAVALRGTGIKAYLDGQQIIALAKQHGCDAIHPGYGFLSENAEFAELCVSNGIIFVGPDAETLRLFGDKSTARALAVEYKIPLATGSQGSTSLAEAEQFFDALREKSSTAAVMLKAIAGGGGRGMRPVYKRENLPDAYARCQSEAIAAFGSGELYIEQLVQHARHIEVQIIGDGQGNVSHLGERECSLQRRHQKLIEVAPSPSLDDELREQLFSAALRLAGSCNYRGLGTFEFLVDVDNESFLFIEANPRVQVEHTVTEMVCDRDLVMAQIQIAGGATLVDLGLTQQQISKPRGYAVQLRINMEQIDAQGEVTPTGGTLSTFEMPSGPGVRVDTFGYAGYQTSPYYDSLLAKIIVHSQSSRYEDAINKARRTLRECHISGIETNASLLLELLKSPDVCSNNIYTRYLDKHLPELLSAQQQTAQCPLYFESTISASVTGSAHLSNRELLAPENCQAVRASMQGVVVEVLVKEGEQISAAQPVAIIESMKMEHILQSEVGGVVRRIDQQQGDGLQKEQTILYVEPVAGLENSYVVNETLDLEYIRPDLQKLLDRKALLEDAARPQAIAKRHALGKRTARENITDLIDEGSFLEYGALAVAAQRSRRSMEDLQRNTPADGLVCGLATVNGELFADDAERDSKARCAVISYDYTVLAGTQGYYNHHKTDRLLEIVREQQLPLIFFCEGGGGRPGDVDFPDVIGLQVPTFTSMATLSGLVPTVGIVSGRCFAGNAALLGCHDVIIATRDSTVGMAGPAMIEGGGLGRYRPEEVGPVDVQSANGVIDVVVEDEAEAVAVAKKYLAYFQRTSTSWSCTDQRVLRHRIPENRLRSYDIRQLIEDLSDEDSVLELRAGFAQGMISALIRIEGRAFGLIANNSQYLGGAIDSDGADKAARFIQLCNAFDIPLISLIDTPGFMVGPDAEKQAQVRHFTRMFVAAANATIPVFAVCLRKGYGLGAQAMAAGSFHDPLFTIAWPTGEFGPMGLEGQVRLGFRKELAEAAEKGQEKALFDKLLAQAYERGNAINAASVLDLDEVIDPEDTRRWLVKGLKYSRPAAVREGKKVPFIDSW